ncbi:hypothetical protein QT970_09555, partial [Microcoleus sp. herbarium8]
ATNALTSPFTGETYSRDGTAPTITSVTATTADGSYTVGTVIPITVLFSETVNVTGTPTLALGAGVAGTASYASGTGSNTLTFNYTVAPGDNIALLDYQSTTALALAGSTIADIATNPATLTLPAPGAAGSLGASKALVIDTISPTVALTTAAPATVTAPFSVTATFTEASASVLGFTFTDITVGNGTASNVMGGPLVYTFDVTPTADGPITVDIPANGATDTALNNNTAAPQLTGITADLPPTVTSVSSTLPDGSYGTVTGIVPITVVFSKPVAVTGAPTLTLGGGVTGPATYASGTGGNTLTFNYTVVAGDTSFDLDYASTTALAGTINSLLGTPANLTLAAPQAAGSLGARALVIDTKPPEITSVTSTTVDGSYGLTNGPINVTVNFDEPVTSAGGITVTLDTGATLAIPAFTNSASA